MVAPWPTYQKGLTWVGGLASRAEEELLATELYVTPRPSGFVQRHRLVDWLEAGLARGLVLVSAPPGSGKTALVADRVIRRRQPNLAWLTPDPGDNVQRGRGAARRRRNHRVMVAMAGSYRTAAMHAPISAHSA
jgi:hypothetical protein